jgi:hypothetical protein
MKIPRIQLRWFRFTLRETLLLVVAVAFGLCWLREYILALPIHRTVDAILEEPSPAETVTASGFATHRGVHFVVTAATDEWWKANPPDAAESIGNPWGP